MTLSKLAQPARLLALLLPLAAAVSACVPEGASVITGTIRPPVAPESVRLYSIPPTEPYEPVGQVSAVSSRGLSAQDKLYSVMDELKEQAAKLGANGIIIGQTAVVAGGPGLGTLIPYSGALGIGTSNQQSISGMAIHVHKPTE